MDSSGNNKLEAEEFRQGLGDFGIDITPEDCQQMMNKMDSNHDGSIDFQEFLRALKVSFFFFYIHFLFLTGRPQRSKIRCYQKSLRKA